MKVFNHSLSLTPGLTLVITSDMLGQVGFGTHMFVTERAEPATIFPWETNRGTGSSTGDGSSRAPCSILLPNFPNLTSMGLFPITNISILLSSFLTLASATLGLRHVMVHHTSHGLTLNYS